MESCWCSIFFFLGGFEVVKLSYCFFARLHNVAARGCSLFSLLASDALAESPDHLVYDIHVCIKNYTWHIFWKIYLPMLRRLSFRVYRQSRGTGAVLI